ncbi:MAG: hypothetical protein DDG58_06045, partial [Ardenticatenia bacterium]
MKRLIGTFTACYPEVDGSVTQVLTERTSGIDVLLVNPPSPDGAIYIRTQHRVGRRSKEGSIYPQVDLAQLAALLMPDYRVAIIDAIAERMSWKRFE